MNEALRIDVRTRTVLIYDYPIKYVLTGKFNSLYIGIMAKIVTLFNNNFPPVLIYNERQFLNVYTRSPNASVRPIIF